MTPGARRVLEDLAADEECDLVQDGIRAYCGQRQTTPRVVMELLRTMAISRSWGEGGATYYAINETGRALLRRPELEEELQAVLFGRGGSFSIVNDRIVAI